VPATPARCTTWPAHRVRRRAINPYLAFETIEDLIAEGVMHGITGMDPSRPIRNYIKACGKGVLKVMSKMGISTVASYTGAQIFEAIGLGPGAGRRVLHRHGQPLGGIGLDEIAEEVARRHRVAYPNADGAGPPRPRVGGEYQWRREGEYHLFNPETVFKLQHATREAVRHLQGVHPPRRRPVRAPGHPARPVRLPHEGRAPIPIDEVEPVSEIVKRFSTGAMSYGSISAEAHETLAIAMNRLGGQVQHRRGRRGPRAVHPRRPATRRSAIKQVASGASA
jgi:glutamate synthase (NADPH) large chain